LEEVLEPHHFVRISKSLVVNLMKIDSIKPFVNARFLCKLKNGEEIIISRKYVKDLKNKLRGEDR
jgi:DNA-binding LytR/AlgR family response regulator